MFVEFQSMIIATITNYSKIRLIITIFIRVTRQIWYLIKHHSIDYKWWFNPESFNYKILL